MTDHVKWTINSFLIQVSDLDRSVQFYTDVLDLHEFVREPEAALLGDDSARSFWLDLKEVERGGLRAGRQALGIRACSFYVGSDSELDRIEERLKALSAFQDRQQRGEDGRVGLVRGHDPDRLPLAFLSYVPPLSAAEHRGAFSLIYAWDS